MVCTKINSEWIYISNHNTSREKHWKKSCDLEFSKDFLDILKAWSKHEKNNKLDYTTAENAYPVKVTDKATKKMNHRPGGNVCKSPAWHKACGWNKWRTFRTQWAQDLKWHSTRDDQWVLRRCSIPALREMKWKPQWDTPSRAEWLRSDSLSTPSVGRVGAPGSLPGKQAGSPL